MGSTVPANLQTLLGFDQFSHGPSSSWPRIPPRAAHRRCCHIFPVPCPLGRRFLSLSSLSMTLTFRKSTGWGFCGMFLSLGLSGYRLTMSLDCSSSPGPAGGTWGATQGSHVRVTRGGDGASPGQEMRSHVKLIIPSLAMLTLFPPEKLQFYFLND